MRLRKKLVFLILTTTLASAMPAWAQQKPFTRVQVSNMVRDGFGDESGAKLIEQRGIDFTPLEDFLRSLKAAGASEAFVKALRAAPRPIPYPIETLKKAPPPAPTAAREVISIPKCAFQEPPCVFSTPGPSAAPALPKPPEPADAKKPINQVQVFALLTGQVPNHRVAMLVQERGIDFEPTDEYLQEVRLAGADDDLITALKTAKVTKQAKVDPAAQAREAELRQHAARGAEFFQQRQYAQAEQEYRATLLLDSQDADVYLSLAYTLMRQEKWDDALAAARESVRLSPREGGGHTAAGLALFHKNDPTAAIAEFQEALRLNPEDDYAHVGLGGVIGEKGDAKGAEWEFREALRLNPKNDQAHFGLGVVLELKNDRHGAQEEYHAAYMLDPENPIYRKIYEQGTTLGPEGETTKVENPPATPSTPSGRHTISVPKSQLDQSLKGVLPTSDLGKLGGSCKWESFGGLLCDIYNGSSWNVDEVTVQIIVKEHDKKKGDTILLTRQYRISKNDTNDSNYLEPLKSCQFYASLGLSLSESQRWSWSFVSASGYKIN